MRLWQEKAYKKIVVLFYRKYIQLTQNVLDSCKLNEDGTATVPKETVDKWKDMVVTGYNDDYDNMSSIEQYHVTKNIADILEVLGDEFLRLESKEIELENKHNMLNQLVISMFGSVTFGFFVAMYSKKIIKPIITLHRLANDLTNVKYS